MAANNLSDIINVQIQIQTPATDSSGFGTMLILGPPPVVTPETAPPDVGVYTSLAAVKEAGWLPADGDVAADPIYLAANVAFAQSPQPTEVYIAIRKQITKAPTAEGGTPTVEDEPVSDTLDRALELTGWYAIATAGISESDYDAIAQWTEANERMFFFTQMGMTSPLKLTSYLRTAGIYGKISEKPDAVTPETNKYINAAWLARCLEFEPGAETWSVKTLSMIEPAILSGTEMKTLTDMNVSYFTTYAGKNVTQIGATIGGEWIDVIRFRDWLKNDMQLRLFNLLLTHPKVPYTDSGITLVQNQMIASLKQGVRQGGISEDEYDVENDEIIPGWTVTVPRSSELSGAEKASRVLKRCKFHARLAGAVHVIEVNGTLAYEEA